MSLFWELHQANEIRRADSNAAHASSKADQARSRVDMFEDRLERLYLIFEAMWELLKKKTGATEEEIMKMVEEIDLSDGKLDGRKKSAIKTCSSCGRTLSTRHHKCLYCGSDEGRDKAFG